MTKGEAARGRHEEGRWEELRTEQLEAAGSRGRRSRHHSATSGRQEAPSTESRMHSGLGVRLPGEGAGHPHRDAGAQTSRGSPRYGRSGRTEARRDSSPGQGRGAATGPEWEEEVFWKTQLFFFYEKYAIYMSYCGYF